MSEDNDTPTAEEQQEHDRYAAAALVIGFNHIAANDAKLLGQKVYFRAARDAAIRRLEELGGKSMIMPATDTLPGLEIKMPHGLPSITFREVDIDMMRVAVAEHDAKALTEKPVDLIVKMAAGWLTGERPNGEMDQLCALIIGRSRMQQAAFADVARARAESFLSRISSDDGYINTSSKYVKKELTDLLLARLVLPAEEVKHVTEAAEGVVPPEVTGAPPGQPCVRCNGRGTISAENIIGDPVWTECPNCRKPSDHSEEPGPTTSDDKRAAALITGMADHEKLVATFEEVRLEERGRIVQWLRLPDLCDLAFERAVLLEAAKMIEENIHKDVPLGPITAMGVEVRPVVRVPELYECAECSAKSGAPMLCAECFGRRAAAGAAWRGKRPKTPANTLTHAELLVACKNIGYDLSCGACAAVFYTGIGLPHDKHTCTQSTEVTVDWKATAESAQAYIQSMIDAWRGPSLEAVTQHTRQLMMASGAYTLEQIDKSAPGLAGEFLAMARGDLHPDVTRILKTLIQRVGGNVSMTLHDRQRADRYQLRFNDNGHTLTIQAITDT